MFRNFHPTVYSKAIWATILAGLGSISTVLGHPGVTVLHLRDWITVTTAALTSGSAVGAIANKNKPDPARPPAVPLGTSVPQPAVVTPPPPGPVVAFTKAPPAVEPIAVQNIPTGLGGTPATGPRPQGP
ncbi:MAG: hypothetical protein NVS3B26_30460 [Mycobacteriales bacterium]